jgi:hypothetical protein
MDPSEQKRKLSSSGGESQLMIRWVRKPPGFNLRIVPRFLVKTKKKMQKKRKIA